MVVVEKKEEKKVKKKAKEEEEEKEEEEKEEEEILRMMSHLWSFRAAPRREREELACLVLCLHFISTLQKKRRSEENVQVQQ